MKTRIRIALSLLLAGLATSPPTSAGEGNGSHASSIILVQGKWNLSDLFVHDTPQYPRKSVSDADYEGEIQLSTTMTNYLKAILKIVARRAGSTAALENALLGNDAIYYTVKEENLAKYCDDEKMPVFDPKLQQMTLGCLTKDGIVVTAKERVKRLKDSNPKDISKLLALNFFHEAWHKILASKGGEPNADHEKIAAFTSALYVMISLQEEQNAGTRRILDNREFEILSKFPETCQALGMEVYKRTASVHPYGGGVIAVGNGLKATIARRAFIDISSLVSGYVDSGNPVSSTEIVIEADTEILDSHIDAGVSIQAKSKVSQSVISGLSWAEMNAGRRSIIYNSNVINVGSMKLSTILNSTVSNIQYFDYSKADHSIVSDLPFVSDSTVIDSRVRPREVRSENYLSSFTIRGGCSNPDVMVNWQLKHKGIDCSPMTSN